jgi:hypothetical protein
VAVCKYCGLEVTVADGCAETPIVIEGRSYRPIEFDQEPGGSRCGDCHVRPGRVHHHGATPSGVRPVGINRLPAAASGPARSTSATNGSRN